MFGRDRQQNATLAGADARRSRRPIDERHFADDLARPEGSEDAVAAGALQQDFEPPFLDEVATGRRIALAKQVFVRVQLDHGTIRGPLQTDQAALSRR